MPPAASYFDRVRSEIAPLLPPSIDTALEIGCGAGATMAWLRLIRRIRYAAAVEMAPDAAAAARAVFDSVEIADAESARMAFAVPVFDLILTLDVLEHLAQPDALLRRLREKLSPQGVLIASIPNVAHIDVAWPLLLHGRWEYQDDGLLDRTHLRFFTERTAMRLFEDNGYTVRAIAHTRKFPNLLWTNTARSRVWRWYSRQLLDRLLRPRRLFTLQVLIAATR